MDGRGSAPKAGRHVEDPINRQTVEVGRARALLRHGLRLMDWATVVGTVGAIASVSSFTPQAWKIIRERRTEGLSLGMFALTTLAFLAWTTFGILRGEWTLIVPNAICLMLAAFILVMIVLPPSKTRKVARRLDPRN